MHEIILILSTMMPTEKLAEDLVDAANEVKLFPDNEEKKMMLATQCMIFLAHIKTKGDPHNLGKAINDVKSMENKMKLFKTEDN